MIFHGEVGKEGRRMGCQEWGPCSGVNRAGMAFRKGFYTECRDVGTRVVKEEGKGLAPYFKELYSRHFDILTSGFHLLRLLIYIGCGLLL